MFVPSDENPRAIMIEPDESDIADLESDVAFLGFELTECTVNVDAQSAKYLRAVHRTALELAVHNQFGVEIGGFWFTCDQIQQLKALADYYPLTEALFVAHAVEAYLEGQLNGISCRDSHSH